MLVIVTQMIRNFIRIIVIMSIFLSTYNVLGIGHNAWQVLSQVVVNLFKTLRHFIHI